MSRIPTCDTCSQKILGSYLWIKGLEICERCWRDRQVLTVSPEDIGRHIAESAMAAALTAAEMRS